MRSLGGKWISSASYDLIIKLKALPSHENDFEAPFFNKLSEKAGVANVNLSKMKTEKLISKRGLR